MHTVKLPVQSVIRNREDILKINETVLTVHQITSRGTLFLKLYLLNEYESGRQLPTKSVELRRLVDCCLRVQLTPNNRGRKPTEDSQLIKDDVRRFYIEHFEPICEAGYCDPKYLVNTLGYESQRIVTQYETNIKERYFKYLRRYVKICFNGDNKLTFTEVNNVVADLVNLDGSLKKSLPKFHRWIDENKERLVPKCGDKSKNSIAYDLQCEPLKYLPCMVYMMKETFTKDEENYIPFNPFPFRTSCVPAHITIDTQTLATMLYTGEHKSKYVRQKLTDERKAEIWRDYFKTSQKCFRNKSTKGTPFRHIIQTDGVSCNLIFAKPDASSKYKRKLASKTLREKLEKLTNGQPLVPT
jgi:hypothetical protein